MNMDRLPACRVCLAYDTRLCSIVDGQLREIYEKLVEASLYTEDMLPTSVCYICYSLMKKMLQFRDRSQKANQILLQMISSGVEPSISSLDMLVKGQIHSISWALGISDIKRTTTTSGELEVWVKIESVKSEMDIDEMSDWNEGAAPPEKRKLEENVAENELVNIETPLIKTEQDEEPRENKEDIKKIFYFKKEEITTSNIISENQNQSAFNKNDTVTPPKDIFTCDLCKNEYQCKINLESHMKKSHGMEFTRKDTITSDLNVANECKSNLLKVQEIQNNDNRQEKDRRENKFRDKRSRYECPYCMKIFTRKFVVTRHLRIHTDEKPFKCDTCEKCFSGKSTLIRHLRLHTNEKPFKCDMCEKCFSEKNSLIRHLRFHTKEKFFKCDLCEKSFVQCSDLTRHLKVHSNEKPFKCDMCEKCFSEKNSLTRHLRVHTKEKPFKCDLCEKSFAQCSDLTTHLRVHSNEKPFQCDICKKSFTQSSTLTTHLRVHTKEKPFKCDTCEKCFSERGTLNKHLRVHTNEKPFRCGICEKVFAQSTHLTSHLRVHTNEKPFKCVTCEKGFTQSNHLTRHLRVHTKEKPFRCYICQKRFSERCHLTRHFKIHTNKKPFKS